MYSLVAVLFTWPKAKFFAVELTMKKELSGNRRHRIASFSVNSFRGFMFWFGDFAQFNQRNLVTLFRFNISNSAEINNKGGIIRWSIRTFTWYLFSGYPQAFELFKIDLLKFPPSRGQKGGSIALPFSVQMPLLKENFHLGQSFNSFSCLWTEKCWRFPQNSFLKPHLGEL